MLDENAMPIPRHEGHENRTIEEPRWAYTGWSGVITFPGGATVTVKGDDADDLDLVVQEHGAEILWNYLELAEETGNA